MLRDTGRLKAYQRAISDTIERFKAAVGRAPHVVDFGAGTGLLSKLALDSGAERVTLVDVNSDMLDMATQALVEHGYHKDTDFFVFHGSFTKINHKTAIWRGDEPFDILVCEILGTLTTTESMHEYMVDALKHVRTFDGSQFVIPASATQCLSLCELSVADEEHLCTRFPHDSLIPPWEDERVARFVPTNDLQLFNLHLKPFVVHTTAPIRVDTFGGGGEGTVLPPVSLSVPSTLSWNHFLVLEWTCALSEGVELKNTLHAYKEDPAVGVDRAVGWGFFLAECGPLYDLCGSTVRFNVSYPRNAKGWPRISLASKKRIK